MDLKLRVKQLYFYGNNSGAAWILRNYSSGAGWFLGCCYPTAWLKKRITHNILVWLTSQIPVRCIFTGRTFVKNLVAKDQAWKKLLYPMQLLAEPKCRRQARC